MAGPSFRFLHAAGFQLHGTLGGIGEPPDELIEPLANAPYDSAAGVLEAAVREEVDFVLLSGDIVDLQRAGPRAVAFLQAQFNKLRHHEIRVYWAGSARDVDGGWLHALDWPDNVVLFGRDRLERHVHQRGDVPLAEVAGRSVDERGPMRAGELAGEVSAEAGRPFPIVVVPHAFDLDGCREAARYWALGGTASARTLMGGPIFAHSPGAPIGFDARATERHGATLVQVGPDEEVRLRAIETETVRWCREPLPVRAGATRYELQQLMRKRVEQRLAERDAILLVEWVMTGDDRFDSFLMQHATRDELLSWVRTEFGSRGEPVWSTRLICEPPESLPEAWCEEDSILGDYLRVVEQFRGAPDRALDFSIYTDEEVPPPVLTGALALQDAGTRDLVLREAAIFGADLLRGDERLPGQR